MRNNAQKKGFKIKATKLKWTNWGEKKKNKRIKESQAPLQSKWGGVILPRPLYLG